MYNAAYIGGDDRHFIRQPLAVVSAGHFIIDDKSAEVSGPTRPQGFPDYQLIYIRKGKGHFFFEDGEQTVGAGQVVLYSPHEPQIYRYFKEEGAEVFWLHFGGSEAASLLEELKLNAEKVFSLCAEGDIPLLISELIAELQLQKPAFQAACRALLTAVLTRVCRCRHTLESSDAVIERACLKIAAGYAKNLTNQELADACNMSVSSFAHRFKEKIGVSPREFLLRRRLAAACFLLENTDTPIGNIAKDVGFEDALYFSKFFRSRTGQNPSDYRSYYNNPPANIK